MVAVAMVVMLAHGFHNTREVRVETKEEGVSCIVVD